MKKTLSIICFLFFASGTIIFGWIYYVRMKMPYNSEGRYFDGEVVWRDVSDVYGIIAVFFLVLTLGISALWLRQYFLKLQERKNR